MFLFCFDSTVLGEIWFWGMGRDGDRDLGDGKGWDGWFGLGWVVG